MLDLSRLKAIGFDYRRTLTRLGVDVGDPDIVGGSLPVDPQAIEVLREMHRRQLTLILACNTVPERPRGPALDAAGITDLFTAIVQSHELGYAKPDPRFFTAIAEVADCPRDQIIYVGDRLGNDVIPALEAGMHAARITPASARCGSLPHGAIRISHISELLPLLPGGASCA